MYNEIALSKYSVQSFVVNDDVLMTFQVEKIKN